MIEREIDRDDLLVALHQIAEPDPLRALESTGPIFPLAHRDDLEDELALIELAISRLDALRVVDRRRLAERRNRLEWWARRIREQLATLDAGEVMS